VIKIRIAPISELYREIEEKHLYLKFALIVNISINIFTKCDKTFTDFFLNADDDLG